MLIGNHVAPVSTSTRLSSWVPLALAAAVYLITAGILLPSVVGLVLFVFSWAAFTAPGWPLARWFAGRDADPLTRTAFAMLLGYAVGATVFCVLRLVGVTASPLVLIGCVLAAVGLHYVLPRDPESFVALPRLGAADRVGLGVLLLIVGAVVGPVFVRVGAQTPAGLAYRAYFVADLFAHMSVVAELVKGAVPPINPYFVREALPYYWGYFTLPATFQGLTPALMVDRGILLTDLLIAPLLASIWYVSVRAFAASALATATSWIVIILGASFEGAYFIWDQVAKHRPIHEVRDVNIDAVTRWYWNMPSFDGLQRIFWYTPQHATAITLGLVAVVTFCLCRRRNALPARPLVDGLLLGCAFIFSSFNGILLVAWYALSETLALAIDRGRDSARWIAARVAAAIVVVGYVGLAIGLGMIQKSAEAVKFGLNRHFMRGPWLFLAISFGPAIFFAPLGLRLLARASSRLLVASGVMAGVAAAIFLYVEVVGHENTYVPFRTGQLMYLVLAFGLAFAIDQWRRWPAKAAAVCWLALSGATLLALPTVAFDWYNARDITNVAMNPGDFPWTIHFTPDEQRAAGWVAQHVPEHKTLQADVVSRGRATWALVPAFMRRRAAVGFALFEPNPARFAEDSARVQAMFASPDPTAAYGICRDLGVDYVYVGAVERTRYGPAAAKFDQDRNRFSLAYRSGTVEIYRVLAGERP